MLIGKMSPDQNKNMYLENGSILTDDLVSKISKEGF